MEKIKFLFASLAKCFIFIDSLMNPVINIPMISHIRYICYIIFHLNIIFFFISPVINILMISHIKCTICIIIFFFFSVFFKYFCVTRISNPFEDIIFIFQVGP
uniref:Uncharacterized protein n=1 Tax=Cacopsylla melanoneura TaxID=428564 RepID=A0A8D8Z7J5_9HEMI